MKRSLIKLTRSGLVAAALTGVILLSACAGNVNINGPDNIPENIPDSTQENITESITDSIPENNTDSISVNISENIMDNIIAGMSMDEKISQMIIPAFRTWNDENVTDLNAFPELKEALKKHQYGGVILYGSNISGTEQVTRFLNDLQENNRETENTSVHIPYLTCVDEEGGIVIRLNSGTRMTGNMAIGATKDAAENAEKTGTILGEELSAAGFNTDFAPDIDVNNNPANPVIGTRSFSDDPAIVSKLGMAYAAGLSKSNVIATYKHFPGHGDTETDSHIGTPSVEKTYEEIMETELVPFKNAIENGADMIMTAHITYPLIDDEVVFGDGITKGIYPATMSKKIITDILRNDLGYGGVVITDALEMDAIRTAGLVPGEEDSAEYRINIAEKVINAGVDILLLPADLKNGEVAALYDDYILGIEKKVEAGDISENRINESVKRILGLKAKYGIFDMTQTGQAENDIEERVKNSLDTIGSDPHHETEMMIASDAITLLKNDSGLLPLSKDSGRIAVFGRLQNDAVTLGHAINELKEKGIIDPDADIPIDYYYDSSADEKLHYTDEIKEHISSADVVVGFSYASGKGALDKESPQYKAMISAIEDTHKAGGKFVLISENLPYDAAIYKDADAVVLAYLGSGLDIDPTERTESGFGLVARNANILAAFDTVFGLNDPKGKLPVNIPVVEENPDGALSYGDDHLYERGYGLSFD
ncbi:MAG: glycoside hydrolase family 3 protein [Lachnospiraceae bacterium]|nr:glycoside hydrolase family 3 protein [Lachnospiraceae bacterium]